MFSSLNARFNIPPIISVASGKGGVGKSLLSVSLSALLSEKGFRVLLIDAALGLGNLHIMTNSIPVGTLEDIFENNCEVRDAVLNISENLDLIPSASGIRTNNRNIDENRLRVKLAGLKSEYDLIILDTPSGISDRSLRFIALADALILIVTPELGSLADGYAVLKLINSEQQNRECMLMVNMSRSASEGKSTAEKFAEMTKRFLSLKLKHIGWLPEDSKIKKVLMRQNILNSQREDCPFFEHLHEAVQYIFPDLVKHEVKGKDKSRGKINSDFMLSSPSPLTDRSNGIPRAGELENNIVNTNVKAQGKTLYES